MTYGGAIRGTKGGKICGISEKELSIFGLTAIEAKIVLCLLERGSSGVSNVSHVTDIPHTSVHSAIRRLQEQGLVKRVSKGYASVWKVVGLEKIQPKLSKALKLFESELLRAESGEHTSAKVSGETNFQTFRNIDSILKVYQWFFLNHYGENVLEIQGTDSFECATQVLGVDIMAQLSQSRVTNRIHTELIILKSILDMYHTYMVKNKQWAINLEQSDISAYIVSDKSLEQNTHTMIAHDAAIVVNWKNMTLELVKTSNLLKLLNILFETLKKNGEFFDHSTYMRHLIEERSKS